MEGQEFMPVVLFILALVALVAVYYSGFRDGFQVGCRACGLQGTGGNATDSAPVDERPTEHRPVPGKNLSPTSLIQDAIANGSVQPFPFEVGRRVNYLGLQLVCTKQIRRGEALGGARGITAMEAWTDAVVCEYVCHDGRIHQHTFESREWPALIAEGERSGVPLRRGTEQHQSV